MIRFRRANRSMPAWWRQMMAAFPPAVVAPPLWLIAPALPPADNGGALALSA